jgi:prepilin-type processing-associated H-X9-DG protein
MAVFEHAAYWKPLGNKNYSASRALHDSHDLNGQVAENWRHGFQMMNMVMIDGHVQKSSMSDTVGINTIGAQVPSSFDVAGTMWDLTLE